MIWGKSKTGRRCELATILLVLSFLTMISCVMACGPFVALAAPPEIGLFDQFLIHGNTIFMLYGLVTRIRWHALRVGTSSGSILIAVPMITLPMITVPMILSVPMVVSIAVSVIAFVPVPVIAFWRRKLSKIAKIAWGCLAILCSASWGPSDLSWYHL